MKMNKKLLALSATFALSAQFGTTAMAAAVDGGATALVIEPLEITEDVVMNFGTVSGGTAVGTVILTTAGARSVSGDAQVIAGAPGLAGSFSISGEPSHAYTATITGPAVLSGAGDDMNVDTFTQENAATLSVGGADTLLVGGTLNIGASQAAGLYSTAGGTPYVVTVNYN
jgi:hypothetical protein